MHVMAYMGLFTFAADVIPKKKAYEVNAVLSHSFCRKPFQTHSGESVKIKICG